MSTDTDLIVKTVAATLRAAAEWLGANNEHVDMLRDAADQVEVDWDGMCCPVCQEVTCDEGCPLEKVRADAEKARMGQ